MDAVLYAQSACDEIKSLIATVNQEDTGNLEKMINRARQDFHSGRGKKPAVHEILCHEADAHQPPDLSGGGGLYAKYP